MSSTLAPVVPIRPGLTARYGDTQAMNDIYALLTGPGGQGRVRRTGCRSARNER